MDPPPQLYSLVLGITLALLRERVGLLQNDLAERVGLTKAKMSRIEKGQTLVDPLLLQKLAGALGIQRESLLAHVDRGIERTQEAVRQTLRLPSKQWQWWRRYPSTPRTTTSAGCMGPCGPRRASRWASRSGHGRSES